MKRSLSGYSVCSAYIWVQFKNLSTRSNDYSWHDWHAYASKVSNPFFTAETKPGGFWFRSDSRQDLYQVLGIPEDADEATIKKAGTGIICEMLRGETDHSWPGLQEVVHSATCLKEIYIVTYCNWGSSPTKTWKYTYMLFTHTVQYSTVQSGWSLMKAPREYGMVLLASCQSQSCSVWMEPGSASSTQVSPRQESRWSVKGKVCGNQKLGIVACHIYNNYNI